MVYHLTLRKFAMHQKIEDVWSNFCSFIDDCVRPDEVAILLAYNNGSCDLKWLWKLTQAPNLTMNIPLQLQFFLDLLQVIQNYKSCPLHPEKTKLESCNLKSIYRFVSGKALRRAHDSLNNVKAQTHIDGSFVINDIFTKHKQNEMRKKWNLQNQFTCLG